MESDEVGTLRKLQAYREILDRLIAVHRGRIFNTAGDSVVADFGSAVDAVECSNLFGDGVNIAARLQALAEPDGICLSSVVRDQIGTKLPVAFTPLREQ